MKRELQFHVFETKHTKMPTKVLGLKELIDRIKDGDEEAPFIEALRKSQVGTKASQLLLKNRESINWNHKYKVGPAIKIVSGCTGVLHFFKDDLNDKEIRDFKEMLMSFNFTLAVWKSFDGKGIECVIKCQITNLSDCETVWHEINETIGLEFVNPYNSKPSLQLLSYDPEILSNIDAIDFGEPHIASLKVPDASSSKVANVANHEQSSTVNNRQNDIILSEECNGIAACYYDYSGDKIRYRTEFKDELFGHDTYHFVPSGFNFWAINTFYKAEGDKRYNTMRWQAAVLVFLNPNIEEEVLRNHLYQINSYQCSPRLFKWETNNLLKEQFEKKRNGTLNPKCKIRKIIFNQSLSLTKSDKLRYSNVEIGKLRSQTTKLALLGIVQTLLKEEQKITQNLVATKVNKSIRTVRTYWKCIQAEIEAYNVTAKELVV